MTEGITGGRPLKPVEPTTPKPAKKRPINPELKELRDKVEDTVEIRPVVPTFQSSLPNPEEAQKITGAAQGKIHSTMPTFQKEPPQDYESILIDAQKAFERTVKYQS